MWTQMFPTRRILPVLASLVACASLLAQTARRDADVTFLASSGRSAIYAPGTVLGAAAAMPQADDLRIVIVEGEGGVNNVRLGSATQPVVEVRDRNNNPVAGASVVFLLPDSGPGGAFAGGARSVTVTTDAAGRATMPAFEPGQMEGPFQIRVQANHQGSTGQAAISQTNTLSGAAAAAGELQIAILEGEGGINNIRRGSATRPVVEVRDRNNVPVPGALVTFTLPEFGASASFVDGSRFFTVATDANGQATVPSMRPNAVEGRFQINVSASKDGQTATATISQTNMLAGAAAAGATGAGLSAAAKIAIVGIVAAGAVLAGVCGSGNCGSDNGSTNGVRQTTPGARIGIGSGPVFTGP
jgi:hypothetical protein